MSDVSTGGVVIPDGIAAQVMAPTDSHTLHWATVEMYDLLTTTDYSDDEIIDEMGAGWLQRALTLAERRLLRARLAALRAASGQKSGGGPSKGDGLDIEAIRAALREWTGPWPPGQDQITDYTSRRVRQVLQEADTNYQAELDAVKR